MEEPGGFVPAAELVAGTHLRLADGGRVAVGASTLWREAAPDAEPFTAYNLEVEGAHTFFVGAAGVWVHNAGTPCERAFSIFETLRSRPNSRIWEAFDKTILKLRQVGQSEILNQKVFNEARKLYFEEGLTEAGPWLNGRGVQQTLIYASDHITPITDSRKLAENLQKVLGYKKIPGIHAHHVIPQGQAEAAELRTLLQRFRIHPDDAANGTFMVGPSTRASFSANPEWLEGLGPVHQNHRTGSPYIRQLNQDLARLKNMPATPENTAALKNELQNIAAKLVAGKYPWL